MEDCEVRLRPADAADRETLARIWHDGWWDAHADLGPRLAAFRTPESFASRMTRRLPQTVVAEVAGRSVGFSVVIDDELEQLYVTREARGSGVARELIAEAERRVAAAGHSRIWLAVAAQNARAIRFYAKSGWRDAGTFEYQAETSAGFAPVLCHRYEREL